MSEALRLPGIRWRKFEKIAKLCGLLRATRELEATNGSAKSSIFQREIYTGKLNTAETHKFTPYPRSG